ncbi:PREDICTED: ATP-dependent DNA helicase PIF1-like [Amphimedon queenslandica]|uniref:ATP-dependent DNA helicase n=1 Tax=Amphimedon queenslandica TaxID=400682 RepID=A0AAN0IVJ8_AMPQE|nr:PREDICTED: ATP-dependent DNA helicase PIF1-like [Amphimedon queenslandica]|eukprot:XP_011410336.1 PREDICTED: ATP-dependent DNA helicase PIF1-like [Amphimedon queenslandica]
MVLQPLILAIHRALNLPVEHGNSTTYRKLGAERLKKLRQSWKYINTIIIDEISMVSYLTISFIGKWLTEIKGTDDTEVLFGRLNVIAVGVFFQLPPVRDKFVFQDGRGCNPGSTHLWRDEFKVIELTQNMRQRQDTEYSEILNRVRIGSQTKSNISVLRSSLTSGIRDPIDVSQPPFVDALCLLPLKEQVEDYNDSRLKDLSHFTKIYDFDAEHSIVESTTLIPGVVSHEEVPDSLIPSSDKECAGSSRKVKLAIGAQVMLRCLVSRVTIDDSLEQEAVPIEPVAAKFYGKQGVTLRRTQLPLLSWWAATIHKVQGLSLDAAVIDLGPKMFEDGIAYIALSRIFEAKIWCQQIDNLVTKVWTYLLIVAKDFQLSLCGHCIMCIAVV